MSSTDHMTVYPYWSVENLPHGATIQGYWNGPETWNEGTGRMWNTWDVVTLQWTVTMPQTATATSNIVVNVIAGSSSPLMPSPSSTLTQPPSSPTPTDSTTVTQGTPIQTAAPTHENPTSYPTFATSNSQNQAGLIIGIIISLIILALAGGYYFTSRKQPKTSSYTESAVTLPIIRCDSCNRALNESEERTTPTNDGQGFKICKDCMTTQLNKQDGICPQCKQTLKWNGNLSSFLGECYHPKCLYELKQGRVIKK